MTDPVFSRNLRVIVLCGEAGCGKTEVLRALAARREQVLDLEAYAAHRGSAFGSFGHAAQPAHREFQRAVSQAWLRFDARRRLWIEDEADYIGSVGLPVALARLMAAADWVRLSLRMEERVARLVRDYAGLPLARLESAIRSIAPRIGHEAAREALEYVRAGNPAGAAPLLLGYYDRAYRHRLSLRPRPALVELDGTGVGIEDAAELLSGSTARAAGSGPALRQAPA